MIQYTTKTKGTKCLCVALVQAPKYIVILSMRSTTVSNSIPTNNGYTKLIFNKFLCLITFGAVTHIHRTLITQNKLERINEINYILDYECLNFLS